MGPGSTLTVEFYSPRWTWAIVWAILIMIMAVGPINDVHAAPPKATTIGAEFVTDTTALLLGRVDPGGLETTVQFYNRAGYKWCGNQADTVLPRGSTATDVMCQLINLQPSTTYNFHVVASNADGVSGGDFVSFTTKPKIATLQPTTFRPSTSKSQGEAVPGSLVNVDLLIVVALVGVGIFAVWGWASTHFRRRKHETPRLGRVFCTQCGAENPSADKFCGKCGQKLEQ